MKVLYIALLACSLFGGTYDYEYKIEDANTAKSAELDAFMYGDFKEIVRFSMLGYKNGILCEDNASHYNKIVETIKEYKNNDEEIRVKIIGHTNKPTDDINEKRIDSKTYANKIQNSFRYSLDTNESQNLSKDYARDIADKFIADEIDEELLVLEHRAGSDMAFTDETQKGRDLSNRVMVTMYVLFPQDIDSDKDGVLDSVDRCPGTPRGAEVDAHGCPIDSDKDGVIDYKDECPDTPIGVSVDKKGCPLDSDGDGVLDYLDECPGTIQGLDVDLKGCPLSKELALNFETNSDKILQDSYAKVVEFATFLKQNPTYDAEIIGHTDSVGRAEANMLLSQKRANAAKSALISEGIDESRLTSKGRGELEPVISNRTKEGRAANRRIEVKLSYSNK
ncbi:OmpA family protein [Sulfurimonas sp.]|uniref:OmpA family protein n=1 Tax=Sulfurimonas sp. TaxID=2022749 RepID=UPI0025CE1196|nr:OmpA family protein [Sulfurimonas sp.]